MEVKPRADASHVVWPSRPRGKCLAAFLDADDASKTMQARSAQAKVLLSLLSSELPERLRISLMASFRHQDACGSEDFCKKGEPNDIIQGVLQHVAYPLYTVTY